MKNTDQKNYLFIKRKCHCKEKFEITKISYYIHLLYLSIHLLIQNFQHKLAAWMKYIEYLLLMKENKWFVRLKNIM